MKEDTAYTLDQHGTLTNVGDDGGADFDVITPVIRNDDGSQTAKGDAYATLFGSAGMPKFEMASGQLATMDGADDPFFQLLSLGPFWKLAGAGIDDVGRLGISAFGNAGAKSSTNAGAKSFTNVTTKGFWKSFDKLPKNLQKKARDNFKLFKSNPNHPSLNFEKLKGGKNAVSARINKKWRAIGKLNDGVIEWYNIIPHTYEQSKIEIMTWSHILIESYCLFDPKEKMSIPSCCTNGIGRTGVNCLLFNENKNMMCPYLGFQKAKSTIVVTDNNGHSIEFDAFESNEVDENVWKKDEKSWIEDKMKVINGR